MEGPSQNDVTRLLHQWKAGDHAALDALIPLVESELRRLARGYMRHERAEHPLQPPALINEAWMRMARQDQPSYEGRSHSVAIAAQYRRKILVDHARKKNAARRGAGS